MRRIRILWTDDEVEVLKPHIIFLNEKGYDVDTCTNGNDTLDLVESNSYDIIFLDEHMPGLSGLETLRRIKQINPSVPVVMITKSEEEEIMEAAIGSQIADYLIKPVKPKQILLSLKKNIDSGRLVTETTTTDYRSEFGNLGRLISSAATTRDWTDLYRTLTSWDLRLDQTDEPSLREIFAMQEQEANASFARFISDNYLSWFSSTVDDKPLLSPALISRKVLPLLNDKKKVMMVVIDNLRYDQWKVISEELTDLMKIENEDLFFSILPTATQYSRNAIFAGLMPSEIEARMPDYWVNDDEEEGKNQYEKELLGEQLKRIAPSCRWSFHKIGSNQTGKKVNENLNSLLDNDLNVLVYNFIDMLSHARTEVGVLRDLADNEAAYRSLTRSWFIHSPLMELLRKLKGTDIKVVITTDHGTIRVSNPVKVIGDRHSSTNIRYKLGRNLDYPTGKVFEITDPAKAHLPKINISSRYIFARSYDYFLYPKNFNHFAAHYRNSFQHGGVSMHEMIIPVITLGTVS